MSEESSGSKDMNNDNASFDLLLLLLLPRAVCERRSERLARRAFLSRTPNPNLNSQHRTKQEVTIFTLTILFVRV